MKQLRILVAEDNRGDVVLIRRALQMHGLDHELHLVEDGEQAMRYLSSLNERDGATCPHVMLLDLNLPKVDGAEVLSAFRRNRWCEGMKVIVITSSDAPEDHARMADLQVDHYFKKPLDLDEFMELGALIGEVVK